MKQYLLLMLLSFPIFCFGYDIDTTKFNKIKGVRYKYITEFEEFKDYRQLGGKFVDKNPKINLKEQDKKKHNTKNNSSDLGFSIDRHYDDDSEYKIYYYSKESPLSYIILFEKVVSSPERGTYIVELIDAMEVSNLKDNEMISWIGCDDNGSNNIIALTNKGKIKKGRTIKKVKKAWKVNFETGKIESTSKKKVKCDAKIYCL